MYQRLKYKGKRKRQPGPTARNDGVSNRNIIQDSGTENKIKEARNRMHVPAAEAERIQERKQGTTVRTYLYGEI